VSGKAAVVTAVPAQAGALARAARSDSEWVWLLAPGAEPRRDALARLLEASQPRDGSSPVILAGATQDASGAAIVRDLPAGDEHNPGVVAAVARHTLPIRSATFANCLVARACFERHGLPDDHRYGLFAPVEWSARVLDEAPGYYVPASVVTVAPRHTRGEAVAAAAPLLRMLRTGAWTRGEALAQLRWCLRDALMPAEAARG
jgi:hypothetical protein